MGGEGELVPCGRGSRSCRTAKIRGDCVPGDLAMAMWETNDGGFAVEINRSDEVKVRTA